MYMYITNEVASGRLVILTEPATHKFPIRIVPKPHQPGKYMYQLIVDLSEPKGKSVNNGISPERCSMQYVSVNHTTRLVVVCS